MESDSLKSKAVKRKRSPPLSRVKVPKLGDDEGTAQLESEKEDIDVESVEETSTENNQPRLHETSYRKRRVKAPEITACSTDTNTGILLHVDRRPCMRKGNAIEPQSTARQTHVPASTHGCERNKERSDLGTEESDTYTDRQERHDKDVHMKISQTEHRASQSDQDPEISESDPGISKSNQDLTCQEASLSDPETRSSDPDSQVDVSQSNPDSQLSQCDPHQDLTQSDSDPSASQSDPDISWSAESASSSESLTDEERDRFAFISQQLSFLNTESGQLATSIHKSDKQTRQERKTAKDYGINRKNTFKNKHRLAAVKRAINTPRKNQQRLPSSSVGILASMIQTREGKSTNGQREVTPGSSADLEDEGFPESDEDGLEIDDTEETDLDERLEANAIRNKLTAINVKNILHHVITNEHVLDMVHNTLKESEAQSADIKEAAYEPKMTRSKTKTGNVVHPWPLSPVKMSKKVQKPVFLEMAFSDEDEEEDEEYEPGAETADSDDDSILSSQMSDFGSPYPTTPSTPQTPFSASKPPEPEKKDTDAEKSADEPQTFQSPMDPPPVPSRLQSSARQLGKKYQQAMDRADSTESEDGTIAHRTRSKLPLTSTSLFELEASFVAPDITADMYETELDDSDWSDFLNCLNDPTESVDMPGNHDDEEGSDPEYNFLADEEEEPDKEDLRNDRAVRITKKEVNELMDELLEAYAEADDIEDASKCPTKPLTPVSVLAKSQLQGVIDQQIKPSLFSLPLLSEDERLQLDDQMIKHTQLLMQIYLLSVHRQPFQDLANTCKQLLKELDLFGQHMPVGVKSSFHPCNLKPALKLLDGNLLPAVHRNCEKLGRRNRVSKQIGPVLTDDIKELMWTSPAFIFRQLLPSYGFLCRSIADTQKVIFTEAEDRLIAMGLEQFSDLKDNTNQLIRDYMMPCKTTHQLKCRVKNQKAKKEDNPIKYFGKMKVLPEFGRSLDMNSRTDLYPVWYLDFLKCDSPSQRRTLDRPRFNSISRSYNVALELKNIRNQWTRTNLYREGGCRSAPMSPNDQLHSSKTEPTIYPLSKAVLKLLTIQDVVGTNEECLKNTVKSIIRDERTDITPVLNPVTLGIPITLVHIGENKLFLSPYTAENQSCGNIVQDNPKMQSANRGTVTPVAVLSNLQLPKIILGSSLGTFSGSPSNVIHTSPAPGSPSVCSIPVIQTSAVTCVAPSFIISRMPSSGSLGKLSTSSLTNTTTVSRGSISSTGASMLIPLSNTPPSAKPNTPVASPQTTQATNRSSNIGQQQRTKSAVEIMAAVAPFLTSPKPTAQSPLRPSQRTPPKGVSPLQKLHEKTPPRPRVETPRELRPSPNTSSPEEIVLPYVKKMPQRRSARRKQLQQKAKAILPKGFVVNVQQISPAKKAATMVSIKARRVGRQRAILPKLQASPALPVITAKSPPQQNDEEAVEIDDEDDDADVDVNGDIDVDGYIIDIDGDLDGDAADTDLTSEDGDTQEESEEEEMADEMEGMEIDEAGKRRRRGLRIRLKRRKRRQTRSSPGDSDDEDSPSDEEGEDDLPYTSQYDSQTEEEGEEEGGMDEEEYHLQQLMTASTTIRDSGFAVKKQTIKDRRRSNAQKRKDSTLAMLAPDLVESDPFRDDRDTAFAQAYLQSVKVALKGDEDRYGRFIQILYEFGKCEDKSPVELYQEVCDILHNYPDLVDDFSAFLLPEQAVQCGCYMANHQYNRVRSFLRKLEMHFEKHPSHFQKIMKALSMWKPGHDAMMIKDMLQPMLRGQQHLLDEFSLFFDDERPPESHMTDFEEVDLCEGDEGRYHDGYEEVELSDEINHYGTKRCECACHNTKADVKLFKRKKHCQACGLKVVGGKIYFQTTGKNLKPAKIIYHKSFWMDETRKPRDHIVLSSPENQSETQRTREHIMPSSPESRSDTLRPGERVVSSSPENRTIGALLSVENLVRENGHDTGSHEVIMERPPSTMVRKRIKLSLKSATSGGRFIGLDEMQETNSLAGPSNLSPTARDPMTGSNRITDNLTGSGANFSVVSSLGGSVRTSSSTSVETVNSPSLSRNVEESSPRPRRITTTRLSSHGTTGSLLSHFTRPSAFQWSEHLAHSSTSGMTEGLLTDTAKSLSSRLSEAIISSHKTDEDLPSCAMANTAENVSPLSSTCLNTASSSATELDDNDLSRVSPPSPGSVGGVIASDPEVTSEPDLLSISALSILSSPPKDSNSSVSQDLLAKAMKAAHVMQSDTDSTGDQSLVNKMKTQSHNKTCEGTEGEIPLDKALTRSAVTGEGSTQETLSIKTEAERTTAVGGGEILDVAGLLEPWTREDDRIILEICKESGPIIQTFRHIAQQMGNKTHQQVEGRFNFLMSLLLEEAQYGNVTDTDEEGDVTTVTESPT